MKESDKKKKDSLYWLTGYVFYSLTLILLVIHLHKENNTDNGYDYAVSYVNNPALLATHVKKAELVEDTINVKAEAIKHVNKAKMLSEYLKKRNKPKNDIAQLLNKRKYSKVISKKTKSNKLDQLNNDVSTIQSVEKKNAEFIENNNLSKETTPDYSINKELTNNTEKSKTTYNNQSDNNYTETNNGTDSESISILLDNYNKFQSISNSTISYSVDGSMDFVDITSIDMIADQLPGNIVTPLLYSKPMGAKAEEDPLDGGGGVDNGGVYNDSGAGVSGSLPISDGTTILIGFAILFIAIKHKKQNNKLAIITNDIV